MNYKGIRLLLSIGIVLGVMVMLSPVKVSAQESSEVLIASISEQSDDDSIVPLKDFLKELEYNYNVNFFYQYDVVKNNFISIRQDLTKTSDDIKKGEIVADLLTQLGIKYERLDEQNYILLKNKIEAREPIQLERVTGTVTDDETEETLPGVNIVVKGTTTGTSTNADGEYSLNVPSLQDTLIFSFIGYQTLQVPINGQTTIDVEMQTQALTGEELVVVGYGTQRKENLTGSVSTVSSSDFDGVPAANTSQLIQGKLPGVTVSSFNTQPGKDNAQIRIRGIGSFNSGQNPLVVIDGVTSSIDEFSQIPASDIENVTVLKDAASAAIYGSRAANGVILVQTNQGSEQAPEITFSSTFTQQTPLIKQDLLESPEYARTVNDWLTAEGSQPVYTEEQIQMMESGSNPDMFANTDWFDALIDPALMSQYYMSVAGGTESTQYMVSTEFKNQPGIMAGTSAEQISIRSNLNIDVGENARIGINLFGFRDHIDEPAQGSASGGGDASLIYQIRRFAKPTVPVKYSNGHWGSVDGAYPDWGIAVSNPVKNSQIGDRYTDRYHLNAKLSGQVSIMDRLDIQSNVAVIYNSNVESIFHPTTETYDASGSLLAQSPINDLTNSNMTSYKILNENTATYQQQFGNHMVKVLAGQSIEYYRQDNMWAYAEGFPNNNIHELTAGVENLNVNGWAADNGLFSLFGRVNYDYQNRYLLEANLRYDGSSRLPEGSRFDVFPSFSAGWILTNESFMDDIPYLSFLKVRASWGKLGNQEIGNYPYTQTLETGQDYIIGGSLVGGAAVTDLANQNIGWETTTITDIGLDANFFEDKLQITADYFDKTTDDLLLRLPIPANQGNVAAPFQNVGQVVNTGVELAVNYNKLFDSGMSLSTGFNVSRVNNEITDLGELGEGELGGWISGDNINVEGQPIGAYYGYVAEGYFQSQDEIDNHASQFGTLRPGDIKFRDLNNDGQIDADNDRKLIGDSFPDFTFGFNLSGRYKGFDATAFIQGVTGVDRFNWYNNELTSRSNFTESIKDRWSEDNRDARWPRFGNTANNNVTSSYWLRDASYLRLKHLEFGYTLPQSFIQKVAMKNMRIYLAGYNLFTLTEMKDFDPERNTGDDRNQGYPGLKNYAVGVSIKF